MAGWHPWLNGRESEWTPGVGDGQGNMVCCSSWSHKESDTTEQLNWTECEHSLALLFFGIGIKTGLFQFYGHCWGFQICWHIECSTSRASSFRIWNISIGIPSPPLALFIVMLPKAHLTSHCRMSATLPVVSLRSPLIMITRSFYHLFAPCTILPVIGFGLDIVGWISLCLVR